MVNYKPTENFVILIIREGQNLKIDGEISFGKCQDVTNAKAT